MEDGLPLNQKKHHQLMVGNTGGAWLSAVEVWMASWQQELPLEQEGVSSWGMIDGMECDKVDCIDVN